MTLNPRHIALQGLGATALAVAGMGLVPLAVQPPAGDPPRHGAPLWGGARAASTLPAGRSRHARRNDILFLRP
ncbi:MAG: hypothetical protein JSR53_11875 [Proteobacteria bacterium]|nr:hypothetical protein [Pseudomonadota bacterium]